jgi:hypothetical protein
MHFNLGVLMLTRAQSHQGTTPARRPLRRAQHEFARALALDPAFREAQAMAGVAATLEGDCRGGSATIRDAMLSRPDEHRAYPLLTGPGDQNAAGRHRRRRIDGLPLQLDPVGRLRACEASGG